MSIRRNYLGAVLDRLGYHAVVSLVGLCVYIVAAVAIFGVVRAVDRAESTKMSELVADGASGIATVTSQQQHNIVCYNYMIADTVYSACSEAPGESWAGLAVGQEVGIIYDYGNPSTSCTCDPANRLQNLSVQPWLFAAFGAVIPSGLLAITAGEGIEAYYLMQNSSQRRQDGAAPVQH